MLKLAGKNAVASAVNKPAPEFTPMMVGLAKALLSTDCNIRPDIASPHPANIADRVLGIRTKVIILDSVVNCSSLVIALSISIILIFEEPTHILAKMSATNNITRKTITKK